MDKENALYRRCQAICDRFGIELDVPLDTCLQELLMKRNELSVQLTLAEKRTAQLKLDDAAIKTELAHSQADCDNAKAELKDKEAELKDKEAELKDKEVELKDSKALLDDVMGSLKTALLDFNAAKLELDMSKNDHEHTKTLLSQADKELTLLKEHHVFIVNKYNASLADSLALNRKQFRSNMRLIIYLILTLGALICAIIL